MPKLLELPGPSRRIKVEPVRSPVPDTPPAPSPATPQESPAPTPEREPEPAQP